MGVIQTRIDDKTRDQAKAVFSRMGMSVSEGIRIFIRQVVNDRALPFCPRLHEPNDKTKKVIENTEKGAGLSRTFDTPAEMWKELNV